MRAQDIRTWRKERDLTLADLATLLGVAVMTVHRWETGKRPVPPYLELALLYLQEQPMLYRDPEPSPEQQDAFVAVPDEPDSDRIAPHAPAFQPLPDA